MVNEEITQNLLKELFDYRDGELYWKVAKARRVKIGDHAGYVSSGGYRQISINDKYYYAHRLVFLYHHGYLPEFLDHVDGDPTNNSIDNLREATIRQNGMNRKKSKSYNGKPTSSRFKGVCWDKQRKKWLVQIMINGKMKHLGRFTSEIEAARSYDKAAIRLFGEFKKLNYNDNIYKGDNHEHRRKENHKILRTPCEITGQSSVYHGERAIGSVARD